MRARHTRAISLGKTIKGRTDKQCERSMSLNAALDGKFLAIVVPTIMPSLKGKAALFGMAHSPLFVSKASENETNHAGSAIALAPVIAQAALSAMRLAHSALAVSR
jgi:hypothetical protein